MTKEQEALLLAPFKTDEVEWRLGYTNKEKTGGYAVPYMNSRAVQNRLDTVLGKENWQNSFISVASGNPKDPISIICNISIYYQDRNEWISKSDGAGGTEVKPVKGGLSDAFKRAASMWGIGRYMYELDEVWVDVEKKANDKYVMKDDNKPKLNAAYEKAVAKIFGKKSTDQGNKKLAQTGKATAKTDQPAAEKQTPAEGPVYAIKSTSISQGKNQNTTVQLVAPSGDTFTAYIQGKVDLKSGQKLKDLKVTERHHESAGKYYVIDEYKVAA